MTATSLIPCLYCMDMDGSGYMTVINGAGEDAIARRSSTDVPVAEDVMSRWSPTGVPVVALLAVGSGTFGSSDGGNGNSSNCCGGCGGGGGGGGDSSVSGGSHTAAVPGHRVDLSGLAYRELAAARQQWVLADKYTSPGPMQFSGGKLHSFTDPLTNPLMNSLTHTLTRSLARSRARRTNRMVMSDDPGPEQCGVPRAPA